MAPRILAQTGELLLNTDTDVQNPLSSVIQVFLPTIGDGSGDTVPLGWTTTITSTAAGSTLVCSRNGQVIATLPPRASLMFVSAAIKPVHAWSTMDVPLNYPLERVTGHLAIPISDIDQLQAELSAKQDAPVHIADVVTLQSTLDGKASSIHSHVISDVTGLQGTLDGKAALSHTHAIADTTGLQTALDGKAALVHSHAQADVTGLVAALAGKAASAHTHAAVDVVSGTLDIARIPTGVTGTTVPFGNDSRFTDSRTPLAHAASHKSGGSDAIKLDELAAPTDVTTLDASTSAHGLLKKLPGGTTTFLRGDGSFATPAGSSAFLRHAAANQTVAADTTQVAANEYEIVAGFTTEIAALGALEIS